MRKVREKEAKKRTCTEEIEEIKEIGYGELEVSWCRASDPLARKWCNVNIDTVCSPTSPIVLDIPPHLLGTGSKTVTM